IRRRCQVTGWKEETQRDIDRIIALWLQLRDSHNTSGPWLCGTRGLVDAFFAPVMTRFRTYGVQLPATLQATAQALFDDADFREWESRPLIEGFPLTDNLYPQA
ncbi:MAG TPA: hypothetical protein VFG52_01290, partial [Xanthomonadales bacterium]|nr:hypothetical protein [Xanthomonadales bacterium]